jgi:hypothetical protein
MTNTVIIIPVNQDTRPTEFYSSFETENGVRVNLTIETREQAVADEITKKVSTLGWTRAPVPSITPLWQIFLLVPFLLLCLWIVALVIGWLLNVAGWLPVVEVEGHALDGFELTEFATMHYVRWAFIFWIPLFAMFSFFELASRESNKKAIVQ